jgi:hypothetical protein
MDMYRARPSFRAVLRRMKRIELNRRGFVRYVTCLLKAMSSHPNRRGEIITQRNQLPR